MSKDPKEFWAVAQTFPIDKETVYPDHAIAQEFSRNTGKEVLEYGCGGGSDTLSYLRRGCSVVHVDIVPGNVELTHQRANEQGFGRHRGIVLERSDKIDLPDGSIDVITSHGVLHHLPVLPDRLARGEHKEPTPDDVLREFRRIIRPNGRLYVMLYTHELWERSKMQARHLAATHGISLWEAFGWVTDGAGCPYAIPYDEGDGKALLARNGFTTESTFVYNNGDFRCYRGLPW